ncbi:AAA family ATPase [Nocardia sp. NPDC049707]|uniref:helix-turn-helix transcriptional regulator n=1 Tax=Nocardia sp. NPDC049707 TaxID=3154735 RepID=UPI00343512B1
MHSGPLRGRSEPIGRALAVVRGASRYGVGGIISVCGPPGVGKTAVLSEICRQAERTGLRVAAGKCDRIGQVQLGAPVIALLRSGRDPLLTGESYKRIVRLAGEPLLLVEAVADELESLAADGPLLIAVDDVHWVDRVSRFVLRGVIARMIGLPVVWVLSTREDGLDTEFLGHDDATGVQELRLAPLTLSDLTTIAQDRLGRIPDQRLRGYLDAIGGNPLLAVQIIDNVARAAARGESDTVPVEFTAAIAAGLARLTERARELVQIVAVAVRPVPVRDLVALSTSLPGEGLAQPLAEALESGLVCAEADTLMCRHDLVRDAIYACIPKAYARSLHQICANYYLTEAAEPLIAAFHAREAARPGDLASAVTMISAAESLVVANADGAGELAALAFRTVRPDQPEWLGLGRRCLSVLSRTQHSAEAIAVADLILARLEDDNVIGEVETQAAQSLWLGGRITDLVARTERVLRNRALLPVVTARLRAAAALAQTRLSSGCDAIRVSETVLAQARTVDDRDAISLALQAAGEAAKNDARHLSALGHFRELRALGGDSCLAEEIIELQFLDRYDHAQALLDQGRNDRRTATESVRPSLSCAEMWLYFHLGRLDEADAAARALSELGRQLGNTAHTLDALMVRVAVALLHGDVEIASRHMRLADGLIKVEDTTRRSVVAVMRGWLTAGHGDFSEALDTWRPVLDGAGESFSYWPLWPCWTGLFFKVGNAFSDVEFAITATDIAELAAARNPGVASFEGMALNLRGRIKDDLDLIARSSQVLARSPRPLLRAGGAESYGRALLAAGDRTAGLVQLDRAWDEYHRMGAWANRSEIQRVMREAGTHRAKWPSATPQSPTGWAALTSAERRIAALIGAGHTNKSAAAELGISVNTVGTHLRSVFAKLGIQSRVQLANSLHDDLAT